MTLKSQLHKLLLSGKETLSIDVRSLAAFRIGISLILIADLINRGRDLTAHYTMNGVLPLDTLRTEFLNTWHYSLYFLSDSFAYVLLLFFISSVFAVLLLIGYHTKIATIGSWILLISLHSRNPMVLQGGDILLRMLLFWALFLPLGAYWSIDWYRKKKHPEKRIFSIGSIAILAQVVFMYFFSALLKTGDEWIPQGTAVYYALSIDQFSRLLGTLLYQFPQLMQQLTYGVYYLELIGPFMLFIPFYYGILRTIMSFAFVVLQVGFGLAMKLGLFPWIGSVAMILFLPSWFWEKILKKKPFISPQRKKGMVKSIFVITTVIGGLFLLYVLIWNVQTVSSYDLDNELEYIGYALRTDQIWDMFSPKPLTDDGWYIIPGTFANGDVTDLFREGNLINWSKPTCVSCEYKNQRWRKYLMNLWLLRNQQHRPHYARYLCLEWNQKNQKELDSLTIQFMREDTLPKYELRKPKQVNLGTYEC